MGSMGGGWRRGWPVAALLVAWGGLGCEPDPASSCEQPGVGQGPCCVLALPDGRRLEGACVDGRCRRADQPGFTGPCDRAGLHDAADAEPTLGDVEPVEPDAADGAPDSAPDGPLDGATDGATDGAPDAAEDPCRRVVCDPGERCDPATATCRPARFGAPGGPCGSDVDCRAGRCLSEADSDGAVPGGYCSVPCVDDRDCGGGRCLDAEGGRLCFDPCDDRGECRAGWTCVGGGDGPGCRVDCRLTGCPGQGTCDPAVGICRPAPIPCRSPCAVGESCEQTRCVRVDGTCQTAYHCRLGQRCLDGLCVADEFTACADDAACGPGQRCVPVDERGVCLAACARDDECPVDRACRADLGACYYTVCGPGTDNGPLLGGCGFGSGLDRAGTCLPFGTPGGAPGYCVEAGLAAPGEPCDTQVEGREPNDRALRCRPGAVCHDDPDDPLDPEMAWETRGICAALCAPGADAACPPEAACVDFGAPDDPETPADDPLVIGLCLDADCRVLDPDGCPGGSRCRPYGLGDDAGRCGPAGAAGPGEACRSEDDCADVALCVSRGAGTECLTVCDPVDADPCGGGRCYSEDGWGFGVCL